MKKTRHQQFLEELRNQEGASPDSDPEDTDQQRKEAKTDGALMRALIEKYRELFGDPDEDI